VDEIERGRIVWITNLVDPQGKPTGDHRAVILTTKEDQDAGKPIQAVVISSKFNSLPATSIVSLPYLKSGHPQTGLDRPSAVICTWKVIVNEEDIISFEKIIYGKTLIEIVKKTTESTQP